MPKFYTVFIIIIILFNFKTYSQKKTIETKSTQEYITIDGKGSEDAWNNTPMATDFVMFEPDNGKPISENKKTEVRILYDNTAIYILAELHDDQPTKYQKN